MMPQPLVKGSSSDIQHEEKVSNALSGVWGKMHGCSCFEGSFIPGVDSPQYMTLHIFCIHYGFYSILKSKTQTVKTSRRLVCG